MTTGIYYEIFSKYRELCDEKRLSRGQYPKLANKLLGTRLAEINKNDIIEFIKFSMTSMGNQTELKYFLPRVFDLILIEKYTGLDTEIVMKKIYDSKLIEWPEEEKLAVSDFIFNVFKSNIKVYPSAFEISDIIRGACYGLALGVIVEFWENNRNPESIKHFIDFIVDWSDLFLENFKSLPTSIPEGQKELLLNWLKNTSLYHSETEVNDQYEESYLKQREKNYEKWRNT